MTPDKLLTSGDVAERLGVTPPHVRRRAGDPDDPLTGIKLGRDWLFDPEHVEQLATAEQRRRDQAEAVR
jgi:hypothetical protein